MSLLDGAHLVCAWLDAGNDIDVVMVTENGLAKPEIAGLLSRSNARKLKLSDELFQELSELPSATGILALIKTPRPSELKTAGFCLLLDGVQDPGNVGAILRTAHAAGVEQVWLSAQCADIWSPKVLRAGMGAQMVLPCFENVDLPAQLKQFSGQVMVTLLDEEACDLYAADLRGDVAVVVGSEGQGVSSEVAALATLKVYIPMQVGIESLNVGHAAAISLYEKLRQNRTT
ncbi:RNA methyltransferase [Chitinibacter sp. SCUT-21]